MIVESTLCCECQGFLRIHAVDGHELRSCGCYLHANSASKSFGEKTDWNIACFASIFFCSRPSYESSTTMKYAVHGTERPVPSSGRSTRPSACSRSRPFHGRSKKQKQTYFPRLIDSLPR